MLKYNVLVLIYILYIERSVVKGFVEYLQFKIESAILTDNLINAIPQYVIISAIVFLFFVVLGIFILTFYYINRKFDSIDIHIRKKYNNDNTYKEDKEELKKDIDGLDAKILPDSQKIINFADRAFGLINKK